MTFQNRIAAICRVGALLLCGAMLLLLAVQSVVMTCAVDTAEHTRFLADSPLLHLVWIALLLAALVAYQYFRPHLPQRGVLIVVGAAFLFAVWWIFSAQIVPASDQARLLDVAVQLREGNAAAFMPGGYLYWYPNQYGMVLLCYVLQGVFGTQTFLAAQVLNCLCLPVIFLSLRCICIGLFASRRAADASTLAAVAFVPLTFYATLVYGTLPGLALALAGLALLYGYFAHGGKWRAPLGGLCMAFAVMCKNNYLIFLVGYVLLLLLDALLRKKAASLLWAAVAVVLALWSGTLTDNMMYALSRTPRADGVPAAAWVAMGLQESDAAPGWYNGYNLWLYEQNGGDGQAAAQQASENIRERLDSMRENPAYALDFFNKKIGSQWQEPTFESVNVQQTRESAIEQGRIVRSVLTEGALLNRALTFYLNIFITLAYVGALLCVLLRRDDVFALGLLIIALGGFLFHIAWEAKSQYVFVYLVLLLPYAVMGWSTLASLIARHLPQKPQHKA